MPGGTNPTGGIVEYAKPGETLTYTAGGTITGGQMVMLTGDRTVQAATAATPKVVGVAVHDAASGEVVTVASEGVWPCIAAGAVAAGDNLIIGAVAGTVSVAGAAPDARFLVGKALEAIGDTATGRVKLGGSL
jgi:predicted RecA/RadA family phage recombinase